MKRALLLSLALVCLWIFAFSGCSPRVDPARTDTSGTAPADTSETDDGGLYHTVIFDSRGGTAVESQQVLDGNPVLRPEVPVREGYFLNGWYTDEAATENEWNFDTDRVMEDITLYAGWTSEESLEPTASLVYELNEEGDGYTVTDFTGEETQLVIPAEYNGLPVTAVQGQYGTGAFARTSITSVVIPDSILEIGQNTFYNCTELVTVTISAGSSLTTIGNNAFSGCSSLENLYLPAGVENIGESAFNNCGALKEFTVAQGNTAYRSENGHLIESATNTLIRGGHNAIVPDGVTAIAQAAFRRTSGITELYIPASVVHIGNYFIADSSITAILYQGTETQWNAIDKSDTMWNHGNREVVVTYSAEVPQDAADILVVYFSNTGNTKGVAQYIAEATGGTLWEIVPEIPYTQADLDYSNSSCRANREQNDPDSRPVIANEVENFEEYDTVFIGYPIWWGDAPRIVQTFLESYDFSDMDVYTFSTSSSSSGSGAFRALCDEYTQIHFIENRHFTRNTLSDAQTLVNEWLLALGLVG